MRNIYFIDYQYFIRVLKFVIFSVRKKNAYPKVLPFQYAFSCIISKTLNIVLGSYNRKFFIGVFAH